MSFLYPRLLDGQARPLFTKYRELPVEELTHRVALRHDAAVYSATGGDRVPPQHLLELRENAVKVARRAGFPHPAGRTANAEFDRELAELLHIRAGMVPAEAAARDVWAFLALVLLPDVAFWRYPRPPGDRVLGTDLTRHVFGRLWWRSQLVHAPGHPEPYHALGILGEAAFDQIYARRVALGGSPHLVRGILRVWRNLDLAGLNERETLRDFLKRLLRLAPFVLFDGVDEAALDEELLAVAQESVAAVRGEAPEVDEPNPGVLPEATERHRERRFTTVELCCGAGGQALGLERAGFDPVLLIDSKADACFTVERNRPHWDIVCIDLLQFRAEMRPDIRGVDLVTGGLPRVKSLATAARDDDAAEVRVFRAAIDLACEVMPKAVLLENMPDLVESADFGPARSWVEKTLEAVGFHVSWNVLNASEFGVPQNRRSGFLVALQEPYASRFSWPEPCDEPPPTLGQTLAESMAAHGWPGARQWAMDADRLAPALVGGSERRGGADLGPTGSKKAWAALRVNGASLADSPPDDAFPPDGSPRLTVEQTALVQGFPADWQFIGGKTSRYRQVGHATTPPLATAVGLAVATALRSSF